MKNFFEAPPPFETASMVEKEKTPRPSIRLEFFRHDEKEKKNEGQDDETVRLTPRGRRQANEAGFLQDPHWEVGMIYGSPKERSQETAYRHLFAYETRITEQMSLEEIKQVIDHELAKEFFPGRTQKEIITEKLSFYWDKDSVLGRELYEHDASKDALIYLWKSSDRRVRELLDQKTTSYSRAAGNIAELVQKYVRIFPHWEKIVKKDPEKYKKFKNEFQRFFGSHQTFIECFLLKVIEKVEGSLAVEDFINRFPDKNGFGFSEGFTVQIKDTEGEKPDLCIHFHEQEWNIPISILDEIIKERDELNQFVNNIK